MDPKIGIAGDPPLAVGA